MTLTAEDVRDLAELLLEKRLGEHASRLSSCQEELEQELVQQQQMPGAMSRGTLVGAWISAYQEHCDQILADLIGLMRSYSAAAAAAAIRPMLDQHLQLAADHLIRTLTESGFGGVTSTPSERNRVANTAAGIKLTMHQRWEDEVALLERASRRGEWRLAPAPELDDRLPLARRRVFDQDLASMARTASRDEPLALLMLDIDHFKKVNDEHGHPVGDEVLLEVARLVVARVAHKGRCYRYGGEELAVLLPTYSTEEATGLAERLRLDLEATPMSSRDLRITASFGVASAPDHACRPAELLEQADRALYAAKHGGRNQVRAATDV